MQHDAADSALTDPPRTHDEVVACYQQLRQRHQNRHTVLQARQRQVLVGTAAIVILILAQTGATLHHNLPVWPMLLSFAGFIALIILLVQLQNRMERIRRLLTFYDTSVARVDGTAPYSDHNGTEGASGYAHQHLYLRDLDIIGPRSLFAFLSTVRTSVGERGLARLLLEPTNRGEALERQHAVHELLPDTKLRENIALLGASSSQQLSASFLDQWLDLSPPTFGAIYRYALALTATVAIALLLLAIAGAVSWSTILPNFLIVLAIQAGTALRIRSRVSPLLETSARLAAQIRLFAEGIELMQTQVPTSPRLLELQRLCREPAGAVKLLGQLDNPLVVIQARSSPLYFLLSLLTAAGTQSAISIANWKRRHTPAMRLWLAAWAEFEALNALAAYAFEHPENAWPELLPPQSEALFEARALGHPLLSRSVRNDVTLGAETRFLLISGSNMAGKSTLLRSIGTATVLAFAGAPVPAASLRLTPLTVGASIALIDSLAEGKSKFLAEVERLAAIVAESQNHPVLFLVDEIFSGTNSLDRRTAGAAVLDRLLANRAIGAFSTHDLALTSLATEANRGFNVHMASPDPAAPLAFDYILRPGVNQHSNALAIIRLIGLDQT